MLRLSENRLSNCPEPIREHRISVKFTSVTLYNCNLHGEDPCQGQNQVLTLNPSKELTRERRVRGKSSSSPPVYVQVQQEEAATGTNSRHFSAVCGILVWFKFCFLHIVADFHTFWQLSDVAGCVAGWSWVIADSWQLSIQHVTSARQRHSATRRPLHLFLKASLAALFCFLNLSLQSSQPLQEV